MCVRLKITERQAWIVSVPVWVRFNQSYFQELCVYMHTCMHVHGCAWTSVGSSSSEFQWIKKHNNVFNIWSLHTLTCSGPAWQCLIRRHISRVEGGHPFVYMSSLLVTELLYSVYTKLLTQIDTLITILLLQPSLWLRGMTVPSKPNSCGWRQRPSEQVITLEFFLIYWFSMLVM